MNEGTGITAEPNDNVGASMPPSRTPPPPALVPVSTHGLFPRDYRNRLATAPAPFCEVSEFDSTTVDFAGSTPLLGTALHYHHDVRKDIAGKIELSDELRYYEEDPETQRFLGKLLHTILPNQSRYEMDLNRPPDTTLYTKPSLAWGQQVWGRPLNQYEKEFSLEKWYEFQTMMDCAVEDAITRWGYAVVFDFHSYNYQRTGPTDWRTDEKPVINVGTRHLDLDKGQKERLDFFLNDLQSHTVEGEACSIQENGVFYGGYLNRRLSHLFGSKVLTLSVEYKKVYMNEATGEIYQSVLDDLVRQMSDTMQRFADHLGVPVRDTAKPPVPSPYTVPR